MTVKSYKSKIRQYLERKILDIQDLLDEKESEVIKILSSDNKNWPRVQELSEEANRCINEWAVLDELRTLKKSEILLEGESPI